MSYTLAPQTPPPIAPQVKVVSPGAPSRIVLAAPRSAGSVWLLRICLLAGCIFSVALVWWSIDRLMPVMDQNKAKALEMSQLGDEVEQLKYKWNPAEAEQTEKDFRAVQQVLFSEPEEIRQWGGELEGRADFAAFKTKLEVGNAEPHPGGAGELSVIPARLILHPTAIPGSTNTAYGRLLSFSRLMMDSKKRFDLMELSVEGDSNSVRNVEAVVQLFASEREAE